MSLDFFKRSLHKPLKAVKSVFGFSNRESKGIVVLFFLILIFAISLPPLVRNVRLAIWSNSTAYQDSLMLAVWVDSLETLVNSKTDRFKKNRQYVYQSKPAYKVDFNPNSVSRAKLRKLGFSDFTIRNLMRYLKNGGRIKSKEDLLKIYGVDSVLVQNTLWDNIKIPESKVKKITEPKPEQQRPKKSLLEPVSKEDINKAGKHALRDIRGIGSWYSKCICDYRNQLGGYASFKQIKERCDLSLDLVRKIEKKFYVDSSRLQHIDINEFSAAALAKHPYISTKLADQIVLYRLHHGDFENINALLQIKTIDTTLIKRLTPYVVIK